MTPPLFTLKLLLAAVITLAVIRPLATHAQATGSPASHPAPLPVGGGLAAIESIEVQTFQPLFNPTSPASPNPEITEYLRHLLNHSTLLPTASPAQAHLRVSCANAYCLSLIAGVYLQPDQPPVWTYAQKTFWFFDVPKHPKTLAKNIMQHLETDYQLSNPLLPLPTNTARP